MTLYGNVYKAILSIVVGLILSNIGVALRLTARWIERVKITIDDYLMLFALLLYWGMAIGGILISQNGLGQPLVNVASENLTTFLKTQLAESYLYLLTVTLTKASILAMYWRALPGVWIRRNVYICGILVGLWAVAVFIANSLACLPIQKLWDPRVKSTCLSDSAFSYGMQVPNILTDIYIVAIPVREVLSMEFARPHKGFLMGIFGIATLTIIFDIIRLVAMLEFNKSHEDITVSIIDATAWTIIEPAVGIFAICLSSLRPLLGQVTKHARHFRNVPSRDRNDQYAATEPQDQGMYKHDPMTRSTDDDPGMESLTVAIEQKEGRKSCSRSISSMG